MLESTISLIKPLIREGRNLVYFASGTFVHPSYKDLKYENVFLVDYSFRKNSYTENKIFCLSLDNIEAVKIFKLLNIKLHCIVGLNEGLFEGGGKYPVNSDCFLGYCFPQFADELIHIGCKEYYQGRKFANLRKHFLDLPFEERELLTPESPDYLNPLIFSDIGNKVSVTKLSKKIDSVFKLRTSNVKILIKHSSIWNYTHELDAIFTRFDSEFQKQMIEKYENSIYPIQFFGIHEPTYETYTTERIVELCAEKKYRRIGVVPNGSSYLIQVEKFDKLSNGYPNEIFFFHLNKGDYKSLYDKV